MIRASISQSQVIITAKTSIEYPLEALATSRGTNTASSVGAPRASLLGPLTV